MNGPGRSKIGQGRNSRQWPKHAWLQFYCDLLQDLKGEYLSSLGSQRRTTLIFVSTAGLPHCMFWAQLGFDTIYVWPTEIVQSVCCLTVWDTAVSCSCLCIWCSYSVCLVEVIACTALNFGHRTGGQVSLHYCGGYSLHCYQFCPSDCRPSVTTLLWML